MSLYSDVELIEEAINGILYGEEEIDIEALDNLMQAKQQTLERGLESLCKIRARKEADIAALVAESKRMKEKAEKEARALDRLEQYIMNMFKRSGEKKFTAGTWTIGTRMSNSVWVSPDFNVAEYMRTTTTSVPDKMAIRDALNAGTKIEGAYMVEKENLSIR